MRLYKHIICLILLSAIMYTNLYAQTNPCLSNLKDANQLNEKGKYDDAIILLKNTISNCNLSKKDKIQANKLLIVNYLAIDNLEEASSCAATIMKLEPNYEPDKLREEPEVIVLFQKYKPTVVIKGLIFGGINLSPVSASQTYSVVVDNNTPGLDDYQSETGFQLGVGAEFKIYSSFWIQSAIQYRKSGYSIQIPNVQGRTISYKEVLNYIDVPVSAKYVIGKGRLQPFVQLGVNLSFLNNTLGELSRDDLNDIVNRKAQRNTFYLGYFGGIGLAYNFNAFSIQAGVNYLYNPENMNKEGTRYDNLDIIFKYYYVDNDFSMNNVQVNIGISYALAYKNILTTGKK